MPLPLLVPIAIGLAGAFGAGKAAKAVYDTSKAKDIATNAQAVVDQAESRLEQSKEETNSMLAAYGKKKLEALDMQIRPFVDLFAQLKNVEISQSPELGRMQIGDFGEVSVKELQNSCNMAHSTLQGLGSGAAGGALAAFGAYNGTMLLASAGTGTAISALSGVAATNATLAWLGGGTLAAGGLGVAGGTMVLGVLVAGPALLIFGSILGAKATKKLAEAKENMEKARTFETEVAGVRQTLNQLQEVTNMASDLLSNLRGRLRRRNEALQQVINEKGVDFSQYDDSAKATVFEGVKYAQLVKTVIDTPILDKEGRLLGGTKQAMTEMSSSLTD